MFKSTFVLPFLIYLCLSQILVSQVSLADQVNPTDQAKKVDQNETFMGLMQELNVSVWPQEPVETEVLVNGNLENILLDNQVSISVRYPLPKHQLQAGVKFPVVLLATGFQTGKKSVELVTNLGNNILVSLDYPNPLDFKRAKIELDKMKDFPLYLMKTVLWLKSKEWADLSRVSLIGVSFGTVTMPLAQRILDHHGFHFAATIYAYGGGDIPEIVVSNMGGIGGGLGANEKKWLKARIKNSFDRYDPIHHLSYLNSKFLFISSSQDQIFSSQSTESFFIRLPEPKERLIMTGPHIAPDQPDLIRSFIDNCRSWLFEKGAIQL